MTVDRSILERLGAQAAEEADALLAASPEPDSIALLSRVHARRRRATSVRRAAFAGAGVALAAAAALLLVRRSDVAPVAPPTASVALPAPTPGPVAVAPTGTPLAFADGTRITVKSGAIAGVREVRDHGATIALDRGTLDVAVVHTDSSRWEIVAGGFEVRVTGTAFEATFDPEKQALTVAMREGSVRVVGPCVDEPLPAPATKTFSCAAAPASTAPPLVASGGPSAVGPRGASDSAQRRRRARRIDAGHGRVGRGAERPRRRRPSCWGRGDREAALRRAPEQLSRYGYVGALGVPARAPRRVERSRGRRRALVRDGAARAPGGRLRPRGARARARARRAARQPRARA